MTVYRNTRRKNKGAAGSYYRTTSAYRGAQPSPASEAPSAPEPDAGAAAYGSRGYALETEPVCEPDEVTVPEDAAASQDAAPAAQTSDVVDVEPEAEAAAAAEAVPADEGAEKSADDAAAEKGADNLFAAAGIADELAAATVAAAPEKASSADDAAATGGTQPAEPAGDASEDDAAAPAAHRTATVHRTTGETDIVVELDLDGSGTAHIDTGVPFFDHMLDAMTRHGLFDITIKATGDVEVDAHHTVEDAGIVLGQAFCQALGDKRGVTRFADVAVPLDEALVQAVVDLSGRGQAYCALPLPTERVGSFDTELAVEFFYAFARDARATLHVRELAGANSHHIIEAAFKAFGRALRRACELDPRVSGVPSTKGSL